MSKKIGVVIPTLGQHNMTHDIVYDVLSEAYLVDIYVVDNEGRYPSLDDEIVIHNSKPESWTRSCNYVLNNFLNLHDYWVLLNNDTRLSPHFFQGLLDAYDAYQLTGVLAPCYDDVHPQQKIDYIGEANKYISRQFEKEVNFVDGTCMFIPRTVIERIGVLDEENFGKYGWGADYDYCIRARIAGYNILVTERSYMNHFRQATARTISSDWSQLASEEMNTGMTFKYGENWQRWL